VTDAVVVPPEKKLTLKAYGNSLPQLFENIARDLLGTFINPEDVGEMMREKVIVEAADTSGLLQGWVNALLSLLNNQQILFKAYRFQIFDAEQKGAGKLHAQVSGELVDPGRHTFRIKPSRWHCDEVRLLNNSKTIEAQVILELGGSGSK